jgi:hypothetical protein
MCEHVFLTCPGKLSHFCLFGIALREDSNVVPRASVEIMGLHLQCPVGQPYQPRRLYVDHIILILERPLNQQESTPGDNHAIPVIKIRGHNDVRNPRLILHRDEDESLRRTRALAGDHAARRSDKFSIPAMPQLLC